VGARRADIVRYFMVENGLITTAGIAVGCAFALAIGLLAVVQYQLPAWISTTGQRRPRAVAAGSTGRMAAGS